MTNELRPRQDESPWLLREERAGDEADIEDVTQEAFRGHPFSRQTENRIVRELRDSRALTLSLVATVNGAVVAHAAVSPVTIGGRPTAWCGLGPVAVRPSHQRRGIGSALVRATLQRLREQGVAGCVVLGDPAYYGRFGFAVQPGLVLPGPPVEHFMAIAWQGAAPVGEVAYHPAFAA